MLKVVSWDTVVKEIPAAEEALKKPVSEEGNKLVLGYALQYCDQCKVNFHSFMSIQPLSFLVTY